MKDFMMIFLGETYEELGLTPEQTQEQMGKWFAWGNKMGAQGILKEGHALHAPTTRVVGAKRTVSDGPFVESKEIIGGYYVVSAESIEKVVEIAQDYPDYHLGGSVEIREVIVFDQA